MTIFIKVTNLASITINLFNWTLLPYYRKVNPYYAGYGRIYIRKKYSEGFVTSFWNENEFSLYFLMFVFSFKYWTKSAWAKEQSTEDCEINVEDTKMPALFQRMF